MPAGAAVLLTSDGVHDQLGDARLTEIVQAHAGAGPQALAEALATAPATAPANVQDGQPVDPREPGKTYRDDATAVVLLPVAHRAGHQAEGSSWPGWTDAARAGSAVGPDRAVPLGRPARRAARPPAAGRVRRHRAMTRPVRALRGPLR